MGSLPCTEIERTNMNTEVKEIKPSGIDWDEYTEHLKASIENEEEETTAAFSPSIE